MKKVLVYLLSIIIIFILDFNTILWFFSNINSVVAIASIINFIVYKVAVKKFKVNKFFHTLTITTLLYVILIMWHLFTYNCINCLDKFIIQLFWPIPICSCILILVYEIVWKVIYAVKNKR